MTEYRTQPIARLVLLEELRSVCGAMQEHQMPIGVFQAPLE